jgi:hypothetical protein
MDGSIYLACRFPPGTTYPKGQALRERALRWDDVNLAKWGPTPLHWQATALTVHGGGGRGAVCSTHLRLIISPFERVRSGDSPQEKVRIESFRIQKEKKERLDGEDSRGK